MTYEPGKTYEISHSRKGRFTVHVISCEGDWVHTRIVDGAAKGLRGDVLATEGESLTFRESLTQIIREIEPV